MANEQANEMVKKEHEVSYEVNGKEVKLSPSIVAQFVTKGEGKISKQEAVNFIQLCHGAGLNPFLNEAYLVKFGTKPAQMIVSKEAFMKRAESNPSFRGFKAGIIVERGDEMKKLDGALKMSKDKLIGAWAEVYREDRDVPIYVEVSMEEFSKGQSTWKQQPSNMIRKVAVVNALREAFPSSLGAMYTEDDKNPQEAQNKPEDVTEEKGKAMLDLINDDDEEETNQNNDEAQDLLNQAQEQKQMKQAEKVEGDANDNGDEGTQEELFEGATTNPK